MISKKKLNQSNSKTDITWVDKGSEFYQRLEKSWLHYNYKEMHSTYNQENSPDAEWFAALIHIIKSYLFYFKYLYWLWFKDNDKEVNIKRWSWLSSFKYEIYKNVFAKSCAPCWS